ncbi:uncharacterized protein LOC143920358 [Arctopsyche grandis]|uniref:uncharacterized protein LOC143920358 n=1 Tax=Arctopsyche grandis TaxID=121162 RepID=UPI00406D6598
MLSITGAFMLLLTTSSTLSATYQIQEDYENETYNTSSNTNNTEQRDETTDSAYDDDNEFDATSPKYEARVTVSTLNAYEDQNQTLGEMQGDFSNTNQYLHRPDGSSVGKTFGFFLNAGHNWRPLASKFHLHFGFYPNYYDAAGDNYKAKFANLWKFPGVLLNKAYRKGAALLMGPHQNIYSGYSNRKKLFYNNN